MTKATNDPATDPGYAAMQAEIEKMRAEGVDTGGFDPGPEAPAPEPEPEPEVPPGGFGERLADAGIDFERTPKDTPKDPKDTPKDTPSDEGDPPAAPEPEADPNAPDPLVEAVAGRRKTREELLAERDEIQRRAEALELPASMRKALANNADREEVTAWLDAEEAKRQSPPAGQPAPEPTPAPSQGAQEGSASAEMMEALKGATDEDTAKVVAKAFAAVEARAARAEELVLSMSQGADQARAADVVLGAARDLEAKCPGILQDGNVHPAIRQTAAALYNGSDARFGGNIGAALEAAYALADPKVVNPTRQPIQKSPATPGPTERPSEFAPVSQEEFSRRSIEIMKRHSGDEGQMQRALDQLAKEVRTQNELAAKHGNG